MSRTVPNKLVKTRAEIEGISYRMVSFFYTDPSMIAEDEWQLFKHRDSKFIIDKTTLAVMSEFSCQFLTRDVDSNSLEPCIVSVEMCVIVDSNSVKSSVVSVEMDVIVDADVVKK